MTHDTFASFGTVLKGFRTRRERTQQQLAEKLGMRRNTIGSWERGDFLPQSKGVVLELARHLHLDDQETRHLLQASLTTLTPHWWVPLPRNPFFTGREEILEALHAQLGVDRAVALTQSSALHGLGGIGKTQIALEYAYRHALEYSAVFWIGAETDEQVIASLLHMAETLQLPEREDKDQQRVVVAIERWLSTHGQWLLIWDNVEDLALLDRFLPSTRSGAILLTTRCQALGTLARGLDLLPMEQKEGILFLLRRAKALDPEATGEQMGQFAERMPAQYAAAADLVTELGGLPLALDQAGAYLEETQCGLSAYLDLFRAQRVALLQRRGERSRDHPASVSTTFALAIAATVHCHPAVRDLLQICALLQPDALPEEIFRQGGEHLGPTLEAICHDPLEWDRVVGMACSYSLLSRQPEEKTLSLHRLVQMVLLDTMTEAERGLGGMRVIEALEGVLPKVMHETEPAAWKLWERLLPHVLLSVHRVGEASLSLPLASLAFKTACYLRHRVRYAEAERLCERALSIQEQALGLLHPEVATSLNGLAILSFNQGRYAQAEQFFERALAIRKQALGPFHPEVATVLHNLAKLSQEQGKYIQAEQLFEQALAIWEQALGPEHPQVTFALENLADLYQKQARYAQAELLAARALAIREQTLGPEHPHVVSLLDQLANLLREQKKYSEAEQLYQRGLAIWEQTLGPEYPRIAMLLDDLAECYRLQERDVEAEQLYQRALVIWEQALGPFNLNVTISLTGLANLSRDRGHYLEAERLYQRALSLREQQLGQHHPDTAHLLHELAVLRQQQGHLSEALSLAERALLIRSQFLGDIHPKTIATRTLSARLLQEQVGAWEEAASELRAEEIPESFADFLTAYCELHPRAWCRSADLWLAYKRWVEKRQERSPLSRMAFTQQLKEAGCRTDRTNRARIWRGITLVDWEIVTGSDGE